MAYFYTNPYEQPLIAARQELQQRLREVELIKQRIEWLQNSIAALEPLAIAQTAPPSGNLADLLCAVLSANPGRPMALPEIRKVIDAMGIRFKKPVNAAAAINITLRRLAAKANSGVTVIYGSEVNPNGGPPIYHGPMQFVWNDSFPKPSPNIPFPAEFPSEM
jgi:hypothetical protein